MNDKVMDSNIKAIETIKGTLRRADCDLLNFEDEHGMSDPLFGYQL